MKRFIYRLTCDNCGEEILGNSTLDLTQGNEDDLIIDIDMIGGFDFCCKNCGHRYFIPYLRDYIEDATEEWGE